MLTLILLIQGTYSNVKKISWKCLMGNESMLYLYLGKRTGKTQKIGKVWNLFLKSLLQINFTQLPNCKVLKNNSKEGIFSGFIAAFISVKVLLLDKMLMWSCPKFLINSHFANVTRRHINLGLKSLLTDSISLNLYLVRYLKN